MTTVESIAKVCHETNRAFCETLGDTSQPTWENAPDWQRESAIAGVMFSLANPDAPVSASHDSWLDQKRQDGWCYGPEKNPEKKEHPCFVPYANLPKEQQVKDYLFKSVVASMARLIEVDH